MTPEEQRERELELEAEAELELEAENSYSPATETTPTTIYLNGKTPREPQTRADNYVGGVVNTLNAGMLNFGDEAIAGLASPLVSAGRYLTGEGDASLSQSYEDALSNIRDDVSGFREENPYTAFFGDVAGATALPVVNVFSKGKRAIDLAGNIVKGGIVGGVTGLGYGFGGGEGDLESRVDTAKRTGLVGGVIGAAVPAAIGGLVGAGKIGNRILNRPSQLASENLRAGNTATNPANVKEIVSSVEDLQNVNPTTATSIFGENPKVAYSNLEKRRQLVGQQIRQTYENANLDPTNDFPLNPQAAQVGNRVIESNALLNVPEIAQVLKEAGDINNLPSARKEASEVLEDLVGMIGGRKSLQPLDLWEIAQNLESKVNRGRDLNKTPSATMEAYRNAAQGIRKVLENIEINKDSGISKLNREYSALSTLRDDAGKASGIYDSRKGFEFLNTISTGGSRSFGGAFAGLAGRAALVSGNPLAMGLGAMRGAYEIANLPATRRALYRSSQYPADFSNTLSRMPMLASVVTNSSLLPRSSEALAEDPEGFAGQFRTYALNKFGDENLADTISAEINDIALNGNKLAQDQVVMGLAQQFPDAFEPPPEGYQSYMDGKILDPMEQSIHINKALDKDLTPRQQAEVIGGMLSKKKYAPIDTAQSNPVQMNQPMQQQNPLSLFNSSFGSEDAEEVPYSGAEQTGDMLRILQDSLTIREEYDPMTAR